MAALIMASVGTAHDSRYARMLDIALPVWLLLALSLVLGIGGRWAGGGFGTVERAIVGTAGGVVAMLFSCRPLRSALGLSALICAGLLATFVEVSGKREVVHQHRNFFDIVRVERDSNLNTTSLVHNTTVHGVQIHLPEYRNVPVSYFS